MKRAYKYRIYPTEEQKKYFNMAFAACRWSYNYALEKIEKEYKENKKHNSAQFVISKDLPQLKKEENTEWIKKAPSNSLIYVLGDLDDAYTRFFKKLANHPTEKNNKSGGSFTIKVGKERQDGTVDFKNNFIRIDKVGPVKAKLHRNFNGEIKRITISKKTYDYYEASILVDDEFQKEQLKKHTENGTIGIDMGVKHDSNVILSDGTKFPTIITKKEEKKIKRLQRKLSKKRKKGYKNWETTGKTKYSKKYKREVEVKKPSKNYIKLKNKLSKIYNKIAHKREYNTHIITNSILKRNDVDTVAIEDLNVKGMTKNHNIAKSIANANMGELKKQFAYKTHWKGINLVQVDRFFPSSQLCSNCGYKNEEVKKLNVRKWICPVCGTIHDRDINAAINIKNEANRMLTETQQ